MSKRWRAGLASAHAARTSWSIKYGKKDSKGEVKRWRIHINASLQRQGSAAEHQAAREQALVDARAKAKALTEDPDVVWVTVYPPLKRYIFNLAWGHPEYDKRLAPVSRWTRRKGWWTEGDDE